MSKPLTGSLKLNPSGTWTASVPTVRGSSRRASGTFETKAAAQRWLAAAVAAIEAGQLVPDAGRFKSPVGANHTRRGTSRFKTYAERWIRERYEEDHHGNVDRQDQITHYADVIENHLSSRGLSLESVTDDDVRDMYRTLLRAEPVAATASVPAGIGADELLTATEAHSLVTSCGYDVSRAALKRAGAEGGLVRAGSRGNAYVYRAGDVFRVAASMVARRDAAQDRYSHSTLGTVRWVFTQVVKYAKRKGVAVQDGLCDIKLPKDESPQSGKLKRAITLKEAARIAARLHVVHQVVFWLLMTVGLRISEAYGLLVEDIIEGGPGKPNLLIVQSQGGTKFRRRAAGGTIEISDHIDETKGRKCRVLVIPDPLIVLLRLVIEIFHTSSDGQIQTKNRLIPGLNRTNAGGQSAFRRALMLAAAAEGLDVVMDGTRRSAEYAHLVTVTPTPHHLRKSFSTALQADAAQVEDIRASLGHRAGGEIFHLHYLIADPALKGQQRVADATAKAVAEELGGNLVVPTGASCTSGWQRALALDAARIDAALMDAGWLAGGEATDEGLISVEDAAAILGVTGSQIRAEIAAGRLASTRIGNRGERHLVKLVDVLALRERLGDGSAIRALAEVLELPYDKVRQYIKRHPALEYDAGPGRDDRVPEHVIEHTRRYFFEQRELEERAIRMPVVATQLGVSVPAIKTLVKHGILVEDIRFHGGVQSITKVSLDRYRAMGGRRKRRW